MKHLRREAAGEPEGALVLLHGRGSDEHDLVPLLNRLDPQRRLLGITLRGPLSLPPGGAHWYAVREIGYPGRETFLETMARLGEWLDGFEVAPERTVIGGFSQGAVMSFALGLGAGLPRPAAIVALSGFVPTVDGFELDLASAPPVAIGHGTLDPVISVDFSRLARELLEDAGADVLYRESPLPHTIDPGFLDDLAPWIRAAVSRGEGT